MSRPKDKREKMQTELDGCVTQLGTANGIFGQILLHLGAATAFNLDETDEAFIECVSHSIAELNRCGAIFAKVAGELSAFSITPPNKIQ